MTDNTPHVECVECGDTGWSVLTNKACACAKGKERIREYLMLRDYIFG